MEVNPDNSRAMSALTFNKLKNITVFHIQILIFRLLRSPSTIRGNVWYPRSSSANLGDLSFDGHKCALFVRSSTRISMDFPAIKFQIPDVFSSMISILLLRSVTMKAAIILFIRLIQW